MKEKNGFLTKVNHTVKEFFTGNVNNSQMLHTNSYRSLKSGWLFDTPGIGHDTYFSFKDNSDIIKAYEQCPPVFSIINKQASAIMNGTVYIMNKKGKEATSEWAAKVNKLLANPNYLQSRKQFEAQMIIYLRLFGYCVLLPIKPVGFRNEDASALWVIPPQMLEFEFNDGRFYNLKNNRYIKRIIVNYDNEESELNPNEVIILKDITPSADTPYLPGSPIEAIQQNISNLIGNYNSKGALINYRGALGILSPEIDPNGAIPLEDDEKEAMQSSLLRYGLRSHQWKFIISNAAMKWQQIGIKYSDLMLTEWAEDDTMIVCDALNYPFKLLSNTRSSSMNGTEAESWKKLLYQDFVVPYSNMVYEQISDAFNAGENKCEIIKDFSHVQALQADELKKAQSRKIRNEALQIEFFNNLITLNRWLELNDEDTIDADMGDKYYFELIEAGKAFGKAGPTLVQQSETQTTETTTE